MCCFNSAWNTAMLSFIVQNFLYFSRSLNSSVSWVSTQLRRNTDTRNTKVKILNEIKIAKLLVKVCGNLSQRSLHPLLLVCYPKNGEAYIWKGALTTGLKQAIASAWTKYILHVWFKIKFQNITNRMALMHDYVRLANFTTKLLLQGKFSAFALVVRGYSFQICCFGNSFRQNVATLQFQNQVWWWNLFIWHKHA